MGISVSSAAGSGSLAGEQGCVAKKKEAVSDQRPGLGRDSTGSMFCSSVASCTLSGYLSPTSATTRLPVLQP